MNKSLLKNEKRIIFLGDNKVGKSTILTQFTKNKFLTNYIPTIGVDNYIKEFKFDEKIINYCLWDTNGDEKTIQILPLNIYQSTDAFIIICSYDSISSYQNIPDWINLIKKYSNKNNLILENNNEDIPIFVLINKVDIKDKFFSRENVLHSVQNEYLNIQIIEISAKQYDNIENLFFTISKKLLGLKEGNNNKLILKRQSSFLNYNEKKTIKCPKCC